MLGAGAAGLMAALFAARNGARVVALDGAKRLGAKILISGGGRCNVTHDVVHASDFNGNRNAIAKVLRTFSVAETIAFFRELGVQLKREETGKLFPVTDRASTVLDALVSACGSVDIRTGFRVERITVIPSVVEGPGGAVGAPPIPPGPSTTLGMTAGGGFVINDALHAKRVILATGGRSVPKTGSDGAGYTLAQHLGHTITPVFPALVPLVLEHNHWLTKLSGTSVECELILRGVNHRERGSMLLTHFGLSGPVVLDMSRHWIAHRGELVANLLPGESFESLEQALLASNAHMTFATFAHRRGLPERLADALARELPTIGKMTRDERRRAIRSLVELPLPVTRDRGFDYAEVTAGGVPLTEVDVSTMRSRVCEGLYLCGEILDVDGKIGGYNFQWAWASGRLAGISSSSA
ncbi:MAG TPA: aminoacetone oxidase family FAD-binding enzyme [Thermoanaerobaculia bacterium]|nr:aminoacetone oxidase family FAD-binding enzyme [Thermoanaerobaculia bacterium]